MSEPTAKMIRAGVKVLTDSGLIEGSWNGVPSSTPLTVAAIYRAMDAAWKQPAKWEECTHQMKDCTEEWKVQKCETCNTLTFSPKQESSTLHSIRES